MAWGRPFLLVANGPNLDVISFGSDGAYGGEGEAADLVDHLRLVDDERTARCTQGVHGFAAL